MNTIDEIHTKYPYYGTHRMSVALAEKEVFVGRKHLRTLFSKMNIRVSYPKKRLSIPNLEHRIYPYLLRNLKVDEVNHVRQTDITYIRMKNGFMYAMAIIDVRSRFIVNWGISNTMDSAWCQSVLQGAIEQYGTPEILNTDQGSQFSCPDFIDLVEGAHIKVSMNGKGRATDNIFIERF